MYNCSQQEKQKFKQVDKGCFFFFFPPQKWYIWKRSSKSGDQDLNLHWKQGPCIGFIALNTSLPADTGRMHVFNLVLWHVLPPSYVQLYETGELPPPSIQKCHRRPSRDLHTKLPGARGYDWNRQRVLQLWSLFPTALSTRGTRNESVPLLVLFYLSTPGRLAPCWTDSLWEMWKSSLWLMVLPVSRCTWHLVSNIEAVNEHGGWH